MANHKRANPIIFSDRRELADIASPVTLSTDMFDGIPSHAHEELRAPVAEIAGRLLTAADVALHDDSNGRESLIVEAETDRNAREMGSAIVRGLTGPSRLYFGEGPAHSFQDVNRTLTIQHMAVFRPDAHPGRTYHANLSMIAGRSDRGRLVQFGVYTGRSENLVANALRNHLDVRRRIVYRAGVLVVGSQQAPDVPFGYFADYSQDDYDTLFSIDHVIQAATDRGYKYEVLPPHNDLRLAVMPLAVSLPDGKLRLNFDFTMIGARNIPEIMHFVRIRGQDYEMRTAGDKPVPIIARQMHMYPCTTSAGGRSMRLHPSQGSVPPAIWDELSELRQFAVEAARVVVGGRDIILS